MAEIFFCSLIGAAAIFILNKLAGQPHGSASLVQLSQLQLLMGECLGMDAYFIIGVACKNCSPLSSYKLNLVINATRNVKRLDAVDCITADAKSLK